MRLVIVPTDTRISIDGESITGCDVSWIPEFVGNITGVPQKVHALQWYDDHGEIELRSNDTNIEITELGIFEQAIAKHAEKKTAIEKEAAEAAAEEEASYNALIEAQEQEMSYGITDIDIDVLLANLEQQKKNSEVIDIDKLIVDLEQQKKDSDSMLYGITDSSIDKVLAEIESNDYSETSKIDINKLLAELELEEVESSGESDMVVSKKKKKVVKEVGIATV